MTCLIQWATMMGMTILLEEVILQKVHIESKFIIPGKAIVSIFSLHQIVLEYSRSGSFLI